MKVQFCVALSSLVLLDASVVDEVAVPTFDVINGYALPGRFKPIPSFDVFLGPFCEDSKLAWSTVNEVVEHYSDRLAVRVHLFPLPYSVGSFLAAQSCVATGVLIEENATIECLNILYQNQKDIKTFALHARPNELIISIADLISSALPINASELVAEMHQELEM